MNVRQISGVAIAFLAASVGISFQSESLKAQTLPIADNLTSLNSYQGQQLLQESESLADYIPLASQFVTQVNQAFCGVASIVMVLNALDIEAPEAPEWDRQYFTQDNVLNDRTEAVIAEDVIARQGLTLAELGQILETYPVQVKTHYGSDVTLDEFRRAIAANLENSGDYVLINYLRRAIGQERGGHISPIAAYDAESDRFLVLDVSRYKYPPVWVTAEELWKSTDTVDSVSDKTRGFLLISSL